MTSDSGWFFRGRWRERVVCLAHIATMLGAPLVLVESASGEDRGRGAVALRAPWPVRETVLLGDREFDLNRAEELQELIAFADALLHENEMEGRERKQRRAALRDGRELADLGAAELKEYFAESPNGSGRQRRGLLQVKHYARVCLNQPERRAEASGWLREIAKALQNNIRPPAPSQMEVGQPPLVWLDYLNNPIARGTAPATNLPSSAATSGDLSTIDPPDSTFWRRPRDLATLDLYHGFGRIQSPGWEKTVWRYTAPKTSYGGCPGVELTDGGRTIKAKFAETMSEPFAARLFWALGYNVEATDYASSLTIRYDRRLFREFHLRRQVQTRITALWLVTVHTINLQKRHDPFAFIAKARLRDGSEITGAELKRRLFHDATLPHPEDDPTNFRAEVEQSIEHLVTVPANVQARDEKAGSIGPWDFGGLGHEDLRELRGAGLLGAWIGWFDSRFENTRLKVIEQNGSEHLLHYFTDLGGGLGKAVGPLSRCCESPNQFNWTFTRPRMIQSPGRMTIPFRIVGYQPIQDTLAFEKMTWEDARWMARWIGRLSEDQIKGALIASGFDSAHVRIYTEKLAQRRDRMIRDLELSAEFPPLRPAGADRKFSYAPAREGAAMTRLPGGKLVEAPVGTSRIVRGQLLEHQTSMRATRD